PDAFFQTWGIKRGMSRIAEALPRRGYRQVKGFWVRKDSPYVEAAAGEGRPAKKRKPKRDRLPPLPATSRSSPP
ncbi:MAG TPA: hypothetical protein VG477_17270, partial [Thermoanaerobaculia bacterium]|nr:hypothetical protein [Thermoanaerobaculia bacterium]